MTLEHYPGMTVKQLAEIEAEANRRWPLQATLMAGLLRDHARGTRLRRLAFRAVRPLFDTAPCTACGALDDDGRGARLWMRDAEGWLTMTAEATLDPA
jgi:3-methylfumaryl-CoA hydratase